MTTDSQTISATPLPLPSNTEPRSLAPSTPIEHSSEAPNLRAPTNPTDHFGAFAQEAHSYMSTYIQLADQKAAFFFAAATALIALLYNDQLLLMWVVDPRTWGFKQFVACVATIGLAAQALMCLSTTVPRLKGSKRGYLYFMAVAEYSSSEQYAADVMKLSEIDIARTWLTHTHELALVAKRKYSALAIGMWAGAVGIIASLLLILIK